MTKASTLALWQSCIILALIFTLVYKCKDIHTAEYYAKQADELCSRINIANSKLWQTEEQNKVLEEQYKRVVELNNWQDRRLQDRRKQLDEQDAILKVIKANHERLVKAVELMETNRFRPDPMAQLHNKFAEADHLSILILQELLYRHANSELLPMPKVLP